MHPWVHRFYSGPSIWFCGEWNLSKFLKKDMQQRSSETTIQTFFFFITTISPGSKSKNRWMRFQLYAVNRLTILAARISIMKASCEFLTGRSFTYIKQGSMKILSQLNKKPKHIYVKLFSTNKKHIPKA